VRNSGTSSARELSSERLRSGRRECPVEDALQIDLLALGTLANRLDADGPSNPIPRFIHLEGRNGQFRFCTANQRFAMWQATSIMAWGLTETQSIDSSD
jgi:hypothetical protein